MSGSAERTHGVAVLANDRMAGWFLPFLRSFRAHNPDLPAVLIPYDKEITQVAAMARDYAFELADTDFSHIDRFARRILRDRYRRRRLRKLAVFDLPFDIITYIDVDTIVLRSFAPLKDVLAASRAEFVYASESPDWVYKPGYERVPQLATATQFSDGFFVTSKRYLNTAKIIDVVLEHKKLYRALRQDQVYCQPVVNFAVHMSGLALKPLAAVTPDLSGANWYLDRDIVLDNGTLRDADDRKVLFLHWAGGKVEDARTDPRFGALWRQYLPDG